MYELSVIKIGGNVVDNDAALNKFLDEFTQIKGYKILVHGGGKLATKLSGQLGIETKMVEGRRITDADTLDICTMVYGGLVNKRIVAMLNARGCKAMGLSGADAAVLPAKRRDPNPVDFGFVGDVIQDGVDFKFIRSMLDAGVTPVFCALTYDTVNGTMLNSNADGIAQAVAMAASTFAHVNLFYCFEKDGVMRNVDDPDSLIETIDALSFETLKNEGAIAGGMIPKVTSALKALQMGVSNVYIKNSDNLLNNRGTRISKKTNDR